MTIPSSIKIPLELKVLKYLRPRMNLTAEQITNYRNLRKGYEGERRLHDLLEKNLSSDYLVINDLLLSTDNTEFQIDTLIIGKNLIYQIEIKNYMGDFYIQKDNWYSVSSGNEIRNPIHQLKRSELLLQRLLQRAKFDFSIEPYILFINPEFSLYEASLDLPIIFPTQINRFITKLNSVSFKQTDHHRELAKYFLDRLLKQSSYERLPDYDYGKIRKGIVCRSCSHFLTPFNYKKVICKRCGDEETVESAVKRSIKEFVTLFPNKKITTSEIHKWCRIIKSKKTIRKILMKHLTPIRKGRYTYYMFKK